MKTKTIEEINEKIKKGTVRVVTAEEMTDIVKELGPERAAEKVDVVTTGTFGAMCSSGVFLNFGHAEPPIKMARVWINDVEAYAGIAAVDAYLGAAQPSRRFGINYGGAHVIQDLVEGKPVVVRAISKGTDCYPRKRVLTEITIKELNQAIMLNPRNSYQKYNAATNSTRKILYTYMGKLLPNFGNVTYSGAGELSPLMNDPDFETIGIGTKIFLAGAEGYIIGNGTQHNPRSKFSTLMVKGNLKEMSAEFLRAAAFTGYGCTLYIGIGVPIPVLNPEIARKTGIGDEDIITAIVDYGVPSMNRPVIREISYAELKSGFVEINGKRVKTSSVSSLYMARRVAATLKEWIKNRRFFLSSAVEKLPLDTPYKPMTMRSPSLAVYKKEASPEEKNTYVWIDNKKCVNCGVCISVCKPGVFFFDEHKRVRMDASRCIKCSLCRDVCPLRAIHLKEK